MKKSLVLGAAALAAVAMAPGAANAHGPLQGKWKQLGTNVHFGGYYMFRMQDADPTMDEETANEDNVQAWFHRLELKMDFINSDKTHAHMVTRVLDSKVVSGNRAQNLQDKFEVDDNDNYGDDSGWDIRQLWMETEAWGIGVKVGNMPIALNDKILVNVDTDSFGTLMLSKSFGDMTLVASNVRLSEGMTGKNQSGDYGSVLDDTDDDGEFDDAVAGANDDDVDLYFLTLLGKAANINYQLTGAFVDAQDYSEFEDAPAGTDNNNWWLAATVGTDLQGVNLKGTVIWEAGWDNATEGGQLEQDGFLAALRAKGKTGFGGWNGYAFWAAEDFTNLRGQKASWSPTWDQGGPGGQDLMNNFAGGTGVTGTGVTSSNTENMWGVGAGLKIMAGGWAIKPHLDYASVVEENPTGDDQADYDSAWGGTLALSTEIEKGTTLSITGSWVDPDSGDEDTDGDEMHILQASIKMAF